MTEIVHSGRWTRDDRAAGMWPRLPFDVPAGRSGISVSLAYDDSGGAVVDLGCEGAAGWRGWSGGARRSFSIGAREATPGYLPGPLEPGEWYVVLGLHRIPPGGVGYEVRVSVGVTVKEPRAVEPVPAERPPRRDLPALPGTRWLACDFHSHTVHSDGTLTVPQLAVRAAARGLDVLAVTDHNTISHHAELAEASARYGVLLLPGQEVTTDTGHANAFGPIGWVDFREPASSWLAAVSRAGGLLSINHPLAADCGWLRPLHPRPPLAEVWHCTWLEPTWNGPLAWWRAAGLDTIPIGGSDFHVPGQHAELGRPVTWVAVPDGGPSPVDAVLDALRAGRTAVSADVADPGCPVLLRLGDELVAVDAEGALLMAPDGTRLPIRSARENVPAASGGHLLLSPDGAVLALSA
ncbi:MAG TPA: CehA/McbA family metallohydrolase [Pseudonocardiaceae bacterium]|nr:CehA/McbA family metallohydrolase [Pseudonocardiaceae bacterium]